jgi:hypothetical protein
MTRPLVRSLLFALLSLGVGLSSSIAQVAAATGDADGEQLVRQLTERRHPWLLPPGPELKSLRYTYHLRGDERVVELARGAKGVRLGMWQGATLSTGLRALVASPEKFQATGRRIEIDPTYAVPFLRLTVRPKAPDDSFHLEVGNGIEGSWYGYYTHPSQEMTVDLDPVTLLPLRELHQDSQYTFGDWQEVKPGVWIPQLVVATRDDAEYRMHFAWQGEAAWLLTHAEVVRGEHVSPIARVSDVLVNDADITVALSAERRKLDDARAIVRGMLDRNAAWLAPQPSFDSLQYTFRIEPQGVTETCAVRHDGLTAFEVSGDDKGQMAKQLGARKIVTPDDRYGDAHRGSARAKVHDVKPDGKGPDYALQLRRYGLSGGQFDLPLFELSRVLDDAVIEVDEGAWNGTPCHVATISLPGRRVYLGCGVMLGFSSWSYVHHVAPAYEVIYIDKQRLVPLHETLVSVHDDRRYEIDFAEYVNVEGAEADVAPTRIDITAKDYFTCKYEFQLAGGRHWMVRTVESWFDPAEPSRGVVTDVQIDQPSELADEAEQQVAAYRDVFDAPAPDEASVAATQSLTTLPFKLGQPLTIGSANVVFRLEGATEYALQLVLQCTADAGGVAAGDAVTALLLDARGALVQAGHAIFVEEDGRLVAKTSFGHSYALSTVARFVIDGVGDPSIVAGAERQQLRVVSATMDSGATRTRGVSDESGSTQVVDVAVRRKDTGEAVAAVHFLSKENMIGFELDATVAAFDRGGRVVAVGSKAGHVRVDEDMLEETWELPLPASRAASDITAVAVGVARGNTTGGHFGSLWTTLLDQPGPFPLEARLAATDPPCWPAGLSLLDRDLAETLDHGILDDSFDWQRQQAEHETPADRLRPHVARLLEIVEAADDPTTLATAIRLLGFAGDPLAVEPARQLLLSNDASVRDHAAIALGLLGRDEGLTRIDEMIGRAEPDRKSPEWRGAYYARRDALIALATIRSEASIAAVARWLPVFIEGSQVQRLPSGGSQRAGTAELAVLLTQLLGRLQDDRYLPILIESLDRAEQGDADDVPAREELIASILNYGPAAHDFIAPRILRGDVGMMDAITETRDDSYIEDVGALLESSTDLLCWYAAIEYLWNRDSAETLAIMQRAFDRGVPPGESQAATRLYLAKALASRGDARGLPTAFAALVESAEPGEAPEDEKVKRNWQRAIDNRRDAALDVFDRAATSDVATFLTERTEIVGGATRLAILRILEQMDAIPNAIRPEVERWAADTSNSDVSQLAERLLVRLR